jgi:serine/threonine protein kinase
MAAALGDGTDTLYWSWYMHDKRMRNMRAVSAELVRDKAYVPTIEGRLREALDSDEVDGSISFIKACLRLNPDSRLSAKDAWSHPWLSKANACMCGYYCKREACGRH